MVLWKINTPAHDLSLYDPTNAKVGELWIINYQ
jgi:hypothetical protein